jgi:hypothetical protein
MSDLSIFLGLSAKGCQVNTPKTFSDLAHTTYPQAVDNSPVFGLFL